MSIYSHPLSFEYGPGYPMFFYYLVGLIISPIMFITGINIHLVDSAIRLAAISSFILLAAILLLHLRLLLNSWIPGVIALIFTMSTGLFGFGITGRPDLFEILMLFCAFLTLSYFYQTKNIKLLYFSIFFAALCFSTKYDGIFLMPILGYFFYKAIINGDIENNKIVKFFSYCNKIMSLLMIAIIPVIGLSAYYIIFKIKRKSNGLSLYQSTNSEYINSLIAIPIIASVIIFILALIILYITKKFDSNKFKNNFYKIYIVISTLILISMIYMFIYILTNPFIIFHPLESSIYMRRFTPLFINPEQQSFNFNSSYNIHFKWFSNLFKVTGIYLGIGTLIISFIGMIKLFFIDINNKAIKNFFRILLAYVLIKYIFLIIFMKFPGINFLYSIAMILFISSGFSIYYLIKNRTMIHLILILLSFYAVLSSFNISKDFDYLRYQSIDAVYSVKNWLKDNSRKKAIILSKNNYAVPDDFEIIQWFDNYYILDSNNKTILINTQQFIQYKQPSYIILTDKDKQTIKTYIIDYIDKNYSLKKQFTNEAYPFSTHGDKYVYIYEKNNL
ncbi:MAG: hypothetical protein HQK91_03780 [Nitrospirae bacterium]|nr:hypothetical protein [Nitrospirota bacterium]